MARILVAGGSLGGLMAANLLARAGHQVTVLEKAVGPMDGRGAGIVTHEALEKGLVRCGVPSDFALGVAIPGRITLDSDGAVLGELELQQVLPPGACCTRHCATSRRSSRPSTTARA